eukprot:TRINITY_DN217_c0_g2_i5.p3 TRINITY_DN217_c0_g2~~TRINITY_DN217_c0_g2_i5.p3  ORF type:complete len:149 (-),score=20.61 TRINITY_DN217_c0_g2_i5:367-813(-)
MSNMVAIFVFVNFFGFSVALFPQFPSFRPFFGTSNNGFSPPFGSGNNGLFNPPSSPATIGDLSIPSQFSFNFPLATPTDSQFTGGSILNAFVPPSTSSPRFLPFEQFVQQLQQVPSPPPPPYGVRGMMLDIQDTEGTITKLDTIMEYQ